MKRTFQMLILGLAVGLGVHFTYYRLSLPVTSDTLDSQLAWMKTELQLTDSQYLRMMELHQASGPRLRAIASKIAGLQNEFQAFEKNRRTNDRVDFLEFARFVETRRHVRSESLDSTRQLVLAAAEVLNPQQRERYLQLISTVEPLAQPLLN